MTFKVCSYMRHILYQNKRQKEMLFKFTCMHKIKAFIVVFMMYYERQVHLSCWSILKFISFYLSIKGYLTSQSSQDSGEMR